METRVYYGEYSLDYWVSLLISGDLVLPEYQRSFVWKEKDLRNLIKSFQDKQFIQPVTIGCDLQKRNIILDGQQRLTSILLAYCKLFPIIEKMTESDSFASEDDGEEDEDASQQKVVKWTFSDLLDVKSKSLRADINNDEKYKKMDLKLNKFFFKKTFLGFSYIIPDTNNTEEYSSYYSHLFRNMNYLGRKLSVIESRRSLYYLNAKYNLFLDGKMSDGNDILCDLRIQDKKNSYNIDFVRYLSILSQKFINKDIMVGYSAFGNREMFYSDYVCFIQDLEQDDREDKFEGFDYKSVFETNKLNKNLNAINRFTSLYIVSSVKNNAFPSIIDADYWLFGLIYWNLFKNKEIDEGRISELKSEILKNISDIKKDSNYTRAPNRLRYVRERVMRSCEVYAGYVQNKEF